MESEHAWMPCLAFFDVFKQLYTHTSSLSLSDNHAYSSAFVHLLLVFHIRIFSIYYPSVQISFAYWSLARKHTSSTDLFSHTKLPM